ncbi:SH3 domain-containing protein [Methylocystis hirsuta]|uniref:SH3 domain-containing protein n=1 Tax=Methylocystis hirsuta TaxID=369798 RepID=A0A3M9XRC2_9HYPH|nr:SH3 domain-containing protein [Methylocystis hirsuta]RNJ50829.1 SH3 domain-containing protein [Methylocystis hirsuta]
MRRSLFAFVLFGALSCAQQAAAIKLTLAYPAVLRAGPEENYAAITTAPAGTEVKILRDDPSWTRIAIDKRRFFVATLELVFMSSRVTQTSGCDFGYPYSGSSQFFASPLAELRHSWPLGDLLGYHNRFPC